MFRIDKSAVVITKDNSVWLNSKDHPAKDAEQISEKEANDLREKQLEDEAGAQKLQAAELKAQREALEKEKALLEEKAAQSMAQGESFLVTAKKQAEELIAAADEEAQAIKQRAREEALKIVDGAEQGAGEIIAKAREEGMELGYSEGYQQAAATLNESNQKMMAVQAVEVQSLVYALKQQQDELLAHSEKQVLDLALKIAGKITHYEMDRNAEVFVSLVKDAIKDLREQSRINVFMNKEQYDTLLAGQDVGRLFGDRNIIIHPEERREKGTCVIECDGATIDASIDTQTDKIADAFRRESGS